MITFRLLHFHFFELLPPICLRGRSQSIFQWKNILFEQQLRMEESHFDDAKLEALIGKLRISHPERLQCEGGHSIRKLCINPRCSRLSLTCGSQDCGTCEEEAHEECTTITLKGVTKLLNSKIDFQKEQIGKATEIENAFMKSLRNMKYPLEKDGYLRGLGGNLNKAIEEIYEKNNSKCLRGKEAFELYSKIKELSSVEENPSLNYINGLLDSYQKILEKVLTNAAEMKRELCRAMSQSHLESAILSSQPHQRVEQIQFLMEMLGKPRRVERIFRASEHDFKVEAFHRHCDNIEDTLVLVKTEFGKVLGGFTHYPWKSPAHFEEEVKDEARKAFIFSLDMREKFIPQQDHSLIDRNINFGPVFGGGSDIFISDECNVNTFSNANFPSTYNRAGDVKLERNQQTFRMFTGATVGCKFRVIEYEVFKVIQD